LPSSLYTNVYPLVTLPLTMKDVGLRIRVQRDLREAFMEACREQDKSATQVLREFMRAYVEEHDASKNLNDKEKAARRLSGNRT
jgi:hypothetical protein